MSSYNVTEWYPAHIKPVYAGVYEVEWKCLYDEDTRTYFNYWNGEGFSSGWSDLNSWNIYPDTSPQTYENHQHRIIRWRGVQK